MTKISNLLYYIAFGLILFWMFMQILLIMLGFIGGGLSVADGKQLCQKPEYKVQTQLGWKAGCYLWQPNN